MAGIPERAAAGPDGAGGPVADGAPPEVLDDLDPDDAFGHPAIADPTRDDAVWSGGDEDDVDV